MTTFEQEIKSMLISSESLFVSNLTLNSFEQLHEVLQSDDCYVINLPENLLLWCSVTYGSNAYQHALTIHSNERTENIYGNIVITSNDDNNLSGMSDLTNKQLAWLQENLRLEESNIHRGHVFSFNLRK